MKRWQAGLLLVLVVLGLASHASAQSPARMLVMPFENVTRDSRIFWMGEAAAVLLADDLNALGASAITREERREAFARLQVPPAASLTDATVIRIGQIVRASQVIVGALQLEGDTLVVRARSITLEAGRVQARVTERGAMSDLFGIFERVARQLAPRTATTPTTPPPHPPVAAFENYIKGLLAETLATAANYLNLALQADPTFDRARLALWEKYDEAGDHERARKAILQESTE